MNPNTVTYDHPAPPFWEKLVQYSHGLLDESDPTQRTATMSEAIFERLEGFDGDMLDEHRYYGLGLIMCGVAKRLQEDSALCDTAIRESGKDLYTLWSLAGRRGRESLQPRDATIANPMFTLRNVGVEAGKTLSPEVQFLNDALFVTAVKRQKLLQLSRPMDKYVGMEDYLHNDGSIKPNIAGQLVGGNLIAAASGVFRVALEKRVAYLDQHGPAPEYGPRTVAEIMREGEVEVEDLVRIGMGCAVLRLDEFGLNAASPYVSTNDTGKLVFLHGNMAPAANLEPAELSVSQPAVLHKGRIGCPVIFVEGLMATIFKLTTGIVLEADRLAVENYRVAVEHYRDQLDEPNDPLERYKKYHRKPDSFDEG
ncbi:MAG TPA: hypothetical protein VLG16_00495 [Candidatus Saccharimonadales bacterium]|nr:hypothetical protein [Candidatus Saccharimonadales bacterium]